MRFGMFVKIMKKFACLLCLIRPFLVWKVWSAIKLESTKLLGKNIELSSDCEGFFFIYFHFNLVLMKIKKDSHLEVF